MLLRRLGLQETVSPSSACPRAVVCNPAAEYTRTTLPHTRPCNYLRQGLIVCGPGSKPLPSGSHIPPNQDLGKNKLPLHNDSIIPGGEDGEREFLS